MWKRDPVRAAKMLREEDKQILLRMSAYPLKASVLCGTHGSRLPRHMLDNRKDLIVRGKDHCTYTYALTPFGIQVRLELEKEHGRDKSD